MEQLVVVATNVKGATKDGLCFSTEKGIFFRRHPNTLSGTRRNEGQGSEFYQKNRLDLFYLTVKSRFNFLLLV